METNPTHTDATPLEQCEWTEDPEDTRWDTQCRTDYYFPDCFTPDSNYKFCPNCGKPIKLAPPIQS